MKLQASALAIARLPAVPAIASAANTITFNSEVTGQTCSARRYTRR